MTYKDKASQDPTPPCNRTPALDSNGDHDTATVGHQGRQKNTEHPGHSLIEFSHMLIRVGAPSRWLGATALDQAHMTNAWRDIKQLPQCYSLGSRWRVCMTKSGWGAFPKDEERKQSHHLDTHYWVSFQYTNSTLEGIGFCSESDQFHKTRRRCNFSFTPRDLTRWASAGETTVTRMFGLFNSQL